MRTDETTAPAPLPRPASPPAAPDDLDPLPPDGTSPQLTARAVLTGMVLGGVLSLCNIYAGLKVGWGFNMSVTAALLGFGFWGASRMVLGTRPFGLLENNVNSVSMFLGAGIALVVTRLFKSWSARFLVVIASGIIAGESLTGVAVALESLLG